MFPSNADPGFAPDNRDQLGALARRANVEVVGGVPWWISRWAGHPRPGGAPRRERIDGLPVDHPRVAELPGIPSVSPALMAVTMLGAVAWRVRRADVLYAPYAYPDGVSAVALGRLFGLPVVVKCRGPDLTEAETSGLSLRQLTAALRAAHGVVVVCEALRERALALGVPSHVIHVVYDGVDGMRFRPRDRLEARRRNGLPLNQTLVLFAGQLETRAGIETFLEAGERLLKQRPDVTLVVAGEGSREVELHRRAEAGGDGASSRILPVGHLPQGDMAEYLAAVDLVCVVGTRGGVPNVLREALATGRPVVASRSGGTAEVLRSDRLGRLIPPEDPAALSAAVLEVLDAPPVEPAARVAEAAIPTWDESATRLHAVLRAVARGRGAKTTSPTG